MPGRHNSTIQEEHIGKYTCTISLLLKPGILPFGAQGGVKNERHVTGHAFHYMPVTVQVYISISSPTENTPRVDHELVSGEKPYFLLLGDAVLLEMDLNGYPFPHISVDSSTAGKFKKVCIFKCVYLNYVCSYICHIFYFKLIRNLSYFSCLNYPLIRLNMILESMIYTEYSMTLETRCSKFILRPRQVPTII